MARYGDIAPTAGPRSERRPAPGMEDKIDMAVAVPLGRPWFATGPPIPPFIYHAIFFGPPLGLYFASRLPFSARSA